MAATRVVLRCSVRQRSLMDLNRPTGLAGDRSPRRRDCNYTRTRAATASIMHQSREARAEEGGRWAGEPTRRHDAGAPQTALSSTSNAVAPPPQSNAVIKAQWNINPNILGAGGGGAASHSTVVSSLRRLCARVLVVRSMLARRRASSTWRPRHPVSRPPADDHRAPPDSTPDV